MRIAALGFLAGTWIVQQLAQLPDWRWCLLLFLVIPLGLRYRQLRSISFALGGFFWATAVGHVLLTGTLDPQLEGRDLQVEGRIVSLPEMDSERSRFQFQAEQMWLDGKPQAVPGDLLLSWYRGAPRLQAGERWRFAVRLKQPNSFMNPGGFDYEAWLFRKGIRATGYVRQAKGNAGDEQNVRLAPAEGQWLNRLRQYLRDGIAEVLVGRPVAGLVAALAVGDRQDISDPQWDTLTRTGTNHLLAISGLHVGLVAGLVFFLLRAVWSLWPRACLIWPAPKAGALGGLLGATAYAMMAGFSVPTQRALVMVAVAMLALLLQRSIRPSSLLATALLLVLIIDPLAVLAPGFWLSFAAVTAIVFGMQGRLTNGRDRWQWGRVQWVVTLGLLPILLLLFQRFSLVGPLANLIAVPWVSLVSVPLTLLGSLLWLLFPTMGALLLSLAAWSVELCLWMLDAMGQWPLAQWSQPLPPGWAIACGLLGVTLLLAPKGLPGRWLGLVWLLPLFLARPPAIPVGEASFTLLDVGQGLAAVVQTREHTLVFDTGPRFPSGFNTGEAVLVPFLRSQGVSSIDTVVVSHGDNDHRGGLAGLLGEMPAARVMSSVPDRLASLSAEPCHGGEQWSWDGVTFQVLHPAEDYQDLPRKGNNLSCVLRVEADSGSVLLSGDIETEAENYLQQTQSLDSDVLVVPHHGSMTSSGEAFIGAVHPRYALFPVGYRNRYGFPKAEIVERYRRRGIQLLDSADHGAIQFRLGGEEGMRLESTHRQAAKRYWLRQTVASSGDSVSLLQ